MANSRWDNGMDADGNPINEWTIADCTKEERRGYVLGIQNALAAIDHELIKKNNRWSSPERLAVAEATLAILRLNIQNLLY